MYIYIHTDTHGGLLDSIGESLRPTPHTMFKKSVYDGRTLMLRHDALKILGPIFVTKFNERISTMSFGHIWPIASPRQGPVQGPKGSPSRPQMEAH